MRNYFNGAIVAWLIFAGLVGFGLTSLYYGLNTATENVSQKIDDEYDGNPLDLILDYWYMKEGHLPKTK